MRFMYTISFLLLLSLGARSQSAAADRDLDVKIVKFYPNPATSIINFDFQKDYDKSYSFQIFSFVGKKMYETTNVSPRTVVNLGDFYRGVYIFQLRDKNGRIVDSGKFQVSK